MPEAAEPPVAQPRLIKRLKGLWSTKPGEEESTSDTETGSASGSVSAGIAPRLSPSSPAAEKPASILDLPRSDMVQEGRESTGQSRLDTGDDDLDIPAFLRRQAN